MKLQYKSRGAIAKLNFFMSKEKTEDENVPKMNILY